MNNLSLVIGNKNYSSWSLRAWLLLRHFQVHFREVHIPLYTPETRALLHRHSPSGKVPVLDIGTLQVWDSLAIAETVNELYLEGAGWPHKPDLRALGRSACAEMHSGFSHLRANMPMNCRRRVEGFQPDAATQADIDRMNALLGECLERSGGPYLLGRFSIADAFFAPVASRYVTYGIEVPAPIGAWMDKIASLEAMQEWLAEAKEESARIEEAEVADR